MGEFLLQTCSHLTCPESAGNPQAPALPSPPSAPASWPLSGLLVACCFLLWAAHQANGDDFKVTSSNKSKK